MKRLIQIIILFVLVVIAVKVFHIDFGEKILDAVGSRFEQGLTQLKTIEEKIIAPPPLYGPDKGSSVVLTVDGVIAETNIRRVAAGLEPLSANTKLTAAADMKVDDMFELQYFEHNSPEGVTVSDLAKAANYDYIVVGENLALGNFADDKDLVQAWMDSPGHRENILNTRFTEIGVSVKKGTYDGRTVWLAVQEFGRPAALCRGPSAAVKRQIEQHQDQVETAERQLVALKAEIENTRNKRGTEYDRKVDAYNELVKQYNSLVTKTKELIMTYNGQVRAFNSCIED